jgi:magnesium-transporting ATPase (P-type)
MVDGIMTEGSNVRCDESALTGETDEMEKAPQSSDIQEGSKKSPFLVSGTKVMDG